VGVSARDAALAAFVAALVDLNVAVADEPPTLAAHVAGAGMALPLLVRRRRPLAALLACAALQFAYYALKLPDISPVPLLALPLYSAAVAGYLAWAVGVPVFFMAVGFLVAARSEGQPLLEVVLLFLGQIAILVLAVLLGEVVRGRRALAAETRERLRRAEEERESEAARRVAEERLRIARDLHDTVSHGVATITVQAATALHLLDSGHPDGLREVRAALAAIRDSSKASLAELRGTLGLLRQGGEPPVVPGGLDRLAALLDAVRAAGVPVDLAVEGTPARPPADVDHAAYRILQEALTNVLRHAGPAATAAVRIGYRPDALDLAVTDDGTAGTDRWPPGPGRQGHGIAGMRERAEGLGGTLRAGPREGGGFEVVALLPMRPAPREPAAGRTAVPR
jgi:signal transduction histidine kinase